MSTAVRSGGTHVGFFRAEFVGPDEFVRAEFPWRRRAMHVVVLAAVAPNHLAPDRHPRRIDR